MADETKADLAALRAYSADMRARVATTRHALGDYQMAIAAFNAAPKEEVEHTIVDRSGVIGADLDWLAFVDAQPEVFAEALEAVDRTAFPEGFIGDGFYQAAVQHQFMQRLAELDPGVVSERGLGALAADYVDRLRAMGVEDVLDYDRDGVLAADEGELAALFDGLALTAQRHPGLADLVVEGLGAAGVHAVVEGLRVRAEERFYSEPGGEGPFGSMLASLATTVQVAARDGGVDQRVLEAILDAAAHPPGRTLNVALLLAAPDTAWPTRFVVPAAGRVFDVYTDWRVSHLDVLAGELFDGDARQAALGALAANPEAAWAFLGDEGLRAEVLFGVYNDGGAAAGAVLRAGLHDYVAASGDAGLLAQARGRFDAVAALVFDEDEAGWAIFRRGDQLTAGAREGLAWALLPHLDSIAFDLRRISANSAERTHLERTLSKLLADDDAERVLAQGYGVYLAAEYHRASLAAGQVEGGRGQPYWVKEFRDPARNLGELALLVIDAEGLAVGEQAAESAFFLTAGEAAAKVAAGVGVAASPLSAGTSVAAGAGASFVIGGLVDQIPVPTYDARGAIDARYDTYLLAAVRAIAADDNLAGQLGISHEARARLADEAFIQAYLRGDAAAEEEFERLTEDPRFFNLAEDLRAETMDPVLGRAGVGD